MTDEIIYGEYVKVRPYYKPGYPGPPQGLKPIKGERCPYGTSNSCESRSGDSFCSGYCGAFTGEDGQKYVECANIEGKDPIFICLPDEKEDESGSEDEDPHVF